MPKEGYVHSKTALLAVQEILKQYSSYENTLSKKQIAELAESRYQRSFTAERASAGSRTEKKRHIHMDGFGIGKRRKKGNRGCGWSALRR